jgi:hypothetical protein
MEVTYPVRLRRSLVSDASQRPRALAMMMMMMCVGGLHAPHTSHHDTTTHRATTNTTHTHSQTGRGTTMSMPNVTPEQAAMLEWKRCSSGWAAWAAPLVVPVAAAVLGCRLA